MCNKLPSPITPTSNYTLSEVNDVYSPVQRKRKGKQRRRGDSKRLVLWKTKPYMWNEEYVFQYV